MALYKLATIMIQDKMWQILMKQSIMAAVTSPQEDQSNHIRATVQIPAPFTEHFNSAAR